MYRGWASNVQLPDCILGKALILRPPTSGTSRGLCPHSLGSTGGRHGDEDGPRAVRTAGRGLHRIAGVRGAGSGLRGLRRLHRERGARPSEVAAARGLPVRARASRRGRAAAALEWLTHHSEVDVRHAEQGLADLGAYAAYYEFTDDEALTIVEMTLRENVFTRRYFRDATAAGTPR